MSGMFVSIRIDEDSSVRADKTAAVYASQCVVYINEMDVRLCSVGSSAPMRALAAEILATAEHFDQVNPAVRP